MRVSVSAVLLFAALAACHPRPAKPPAPQPVRAHGVVLMGRGEYPASAVEKVLQLAGGERPRILVLSAGKDTVSGPAAAIAFRSAGAIATDIRLTREMAESSNIIAILGGQDAVWLTGTNAQELGVALGGTATARALVQRFTNGMTLGGDRAGAAMLGAVMVTGGDEPPATRGRRRRAAQDTGIATAEGLGVVIGSLIYAPSSERHRPTALREAVAIHTRLLGVMLDSASAIAVENGAWTSVGDQPVEIVEFGTQTAVSPDSVASTDSTAFLSRTLAPGEHFEPRARAGRIP